MDSEIIEHWYNVFDSGRQLDSEGGLEPGRVFSDFSMAHFFIDDLSNKTLNIHREDFDPIWPTDTHPWVSFPLFAILAKRNSIAMSNEVKLNMLHT